MHNRKSHVLWIGIMGLFFLFLYFFNTTLDYNKPGDIPTGIVYEKAKITHIISEELGPDPDFPNIKIGKQELKLMIMTGNHKGEIVEAKNYIGRVDNKPVKVGTKVIISSFDEFITTTIVNYSRETTLYALLLLFLFIIIVFGKMKGFTSIFSLVFTIICIIFLFIPMIIRGVLPILAACIIVILSTVVSLLSLNGWSKKTIISIISCIACTLLAGVIAYLAGHVTHISTYNTIEAENLLYISTNTALQVKDLIFAGILISTLGAIMDTSMSITSAACELKELNPKLNEKQLLLSGMNVGKDVMGTMTNTLILAFTGSSLNTIIILYMYNLPYIQLLNMDLLVIEMIQGLSGSIAVILCIPITALLSSKILTNKPLLSKKP